MYHFNSSNNNSCCDYHFLSLSLQLYTRDLEKEDGQEKKNLLWIQMIYQYLQSLLMDCHIHVPRKLCIKTASRHTFCHCSSWRSYKCPFQAQEQWLISSSITSQPQERYGTIKVCSKICPQKYFRNWVQILQSQLGLLNIFWLPKGAQRTRKQDNNTGYKNLIYTEDEIIWWELQWHAILKQLQFWFGLLYSWIQLLKTKLIFVLPFKISGWMFSLLDSFTYESASCVKRSSQAQGLN